MAECSSCGSAPAQEGSDKCSTCKANVSDNDADMANADHSADDGHDHTSEEGAEPQNSDNADQTDQG